MKYFISTLVLIILLTSNTWAEVQNIQTDGPWSSYIKHESNEYYRELYSNNSKNIHIAILFINNSPKIALIISELSEKEITEWKNFENRNISGAARIDYNNRIFHIDYLVSVNKDNVIFYVIDDDIHSSLIEEMKTGKTVRFRIPGKNENKFLLYSLSNFAKAYERAKNLPLPVAPVSVEEGISTPTHQ